MGRGHILVVLCVLAGLALTCCGCGAPSPLIVTDLQTEASYPLPPLVSKHLREAVRKPHDKSYTASEMLLWMRNNTADGHFQSGGRRYFVFHHTIACEQDGEWRAWNVDRLWGLGENVSSQREDGGTANWTTAAKWLESFLERREKRRQTKPKLPDFTKHLDAPMFLQDSKKYKLSPLLTAHVRRTVQQEPSRIVPQDEIGGCGGHPPLAFIRMGDIGLNVEHWGLYYEDTFYHYKWKTDPALQSAIRLARKQKSFDWAQVLKWWEDNLKSAAPKSKDAVDDKQKKAD